MHGRAHQLFADSRVQLVSIHAAVYFSLTRTEHCSTSEQPALLSRGAGLDHHTLDSRAQKP